MKNFDDHSRSFMYFFNPDVPPLLSGFFARRGPALKIIDVGCGDGTLVRALKEKNLLRPEDRVEGIDLSEVRTKNFTAYTGYPARTYDGVKFAGIPDRSLDLVITTQVMEHVESEKVWLDEINRVLKKDGTLFLSTVMKKRFAWYYYRNRYRQWVLEPTHLREYRSVEEIGTILAASGFTMTQHELSAMRFSPGNLVLRIANRVLGLKNFAERVDRSVFLRKMRSWTVSIPGYRNVELLASKNG